jgi:hypothetical protein
MKTVIEMAQEAGFLFNKYGLLQGDDNGEIDADEALERFAELVRADEREACTKKTEEFARKWWKIHCDSNLHYSSTLKAHQDFCALQAAIRARGNT